MLGVRKIVDQLLGRRVPHQKLSVIGRILNDPDWSESKTEPLLCNLGEAARRLGCSRSRFGNSENRVLFQLWCSRVYVMFAHGTWRISFVNFNTRR
jgi:hypothetical protein